MTATSVLLVLVCEWCESQQEKWWRAARFLQPALASLIATLRAPKSSEGYKKIGGGSPLRRITQEQGQALEDALAVRGPASDRLCGHAVLEALH